MPETARTSEQSSEMKVLTLCEVAEFLKVSEKSVLRLVQKGELPAAKVGGQWRFVQQTLDEWLRDQMRPTAPHPLVEAVETQVEVVPFSRFLEERRIVPDLAPGDKKEILSALVARLAETGGTDDPEGLLGRLLAREAMASTAVPGGLALPHPRDPAAECILEPSAVLGVCPQGTDFGAPDGSPTYVLVLLCARSVVAHIRLLSRVSSLFGGGEERIEAVRAAGDPREILSLLVEEDLRSTLAPPPGAAS